MAEENNADWLTKFIVDEAQLNRDATGKSVPQPETKSEVPLWKKLLERPFIIPVKLEVTSATGSHDTGFVNLLTPSAKLAMVMSKYSGQIVKEKIDIGYKTAGAPWAPRVPFRVPRRLR